MALSWMTNKRRTTVVPLIFNTTEVKLLLKEDFS